jgi:hypothetical protein
VLLASHVWLEDSSLRVLEFLTFKLTCPKNVTDLTWLCLLRPLIWLGVVPPHDLLSFSNGESKSKTSSECHFDKIKTVFPLVIVRL